MSAGTPRIHLWRLNRQADASASVDASRDETCNAAWARWSAEQTAAVSRAKWALNQAYAELQYERPPAPPWSCGPNRWGLYVSLESVGSEIHRLHRENARLAAMCKQRPAQ